MRMMTGLDIAREACYFKVRRGGSQHWHRIINHFPRQNIHLAYCGKLQNFDMELAVYAGEWNAAEFRGIWVECGTCERLYLDG
jgi:hypothetical protein